MPIPSGEVIAGVRLLVLGLLICSQTQRGVDVATEDYDEAVALREYVYRNYRHLLTPLERRTTEYTAPIVSNSEHWKIKRLHTFLEERDGHVSDAEVTAAFAIPIDERRQRAFNRVITEQRGCIDENRCPKCGRLVKTPQARQCLWCGYDWH